jgi:hypothetical protein
MEQLIIYHNKINSIIKVILISRFIKVWIDTLYVDKHELCAEGTVFHNADLGVDKKLRD